MTARPVVPLFPANDSSLTNLNNLSASVAFLGTSIAQWHFYKNSDTGPLAINTNTQIPMGSTAYDSDGVFQAPGQANIVTRGYYDCEATLPFTNTAAGGQTVGAWFLVVTGANNPQGSGVNIRFGQLFDLTTGNADEMSVTIFGTSPCLYPGDVVQVFLKVGGSAVTVNHAWNASGNNDLGGFPDGGAYFTGMWISEGP